MEKEVRRTTGGGGGGELDTHPPPLRPWAKCLDLDHNTVVCFLDVARVRWCFSTIPPFEWPIPRNF